MVLYQTGFSKLGISEPGRNDGAAAPARRETKIKLLYSSICNNNNNQRKN